jgi:hypothetical protein
LKYKNNGHKAWCNRYVNRISQNDIEVEKMDMTGQFNIQDSIDSIQKKATFRNINTMDSDRTHLHDINKATFESTNENLIEESVDINIQES